MEALQPLPLPAYLSGEKSLPSVQPEVPKLQLMVIVVHHITWFGSAGPQVTSSPFLQGILVLISATELTC